MSDEPVNDFLKGAIQQQAGLSPGWGDSWATHAGAGYTKAHEDLLKVGQTGPSQPSSSGGGDISHRSFWIIMAVITSPWTFGYAEDKVKTAYNSVQTRATALVDSIFPEPIPAVNYIKGMPPREAKVSGRYFQYTTVGDHPEIAKEEELRNEDVTVVGCSRGDWHNDGYCQIERKVAPPKSGFQLFGSRNGPKKNEGYIVIKGSDRWSLLRHNIEFKDGNPSYNFIEDDHSAANGSSNEKIDIDSLPRHHFVSGRLEQIDSYNPSSDAIIYLKEAPVRTARVTGWFFAYESGIKYPLCSRAGVMLKNEYVQITGCSRRAGGYCQVTRAATFSEWGVRENLEKVEGFIRLSETVQFKDGKLLDFVEDRPEIKKIEEEKHDGSKEAARTNVVTAFPDASAKVNKPATTSATEVKPLIPHEQADVRKGIQACSDYYALTYPKLDEGRRMALCGATVFAPR